MTKPVCYTQAGRLMAIDNRPRRGRPPARARLEVEEGINRLFTIQARVRAQRDEVRPDEIVGTAADLALTLADGSQRVWNGSSPELHEGPIVTRGARQYALTLRPRLWLMSQRSDCRIFLTQSTLEVLETLCAEHGIRDYTLAGVTRPPQKRDYSRAVERDRSRVPLRRRLEEEGHFFWFRHERASTRSWSAIIPRPMTAGPRPGSSCLRLVGCRAHPRLAPATLVHARTKSRKGLRISNTKS